jgi:hypothetical protein
MLFLAVSFQVMKYIVHLSSGKVYVQEYVVLLAFYKLKSNMNKANVFLFS